MTLANQRLRWDGDLLFLYLRKHKLSLTPRILGWKTFLFTMIYGVAQNVVFRCWSWGTAGGWCSAIRARLWRP